MKVPAGGLACLFLFTGGHARGQEAGGFQEVLADRGLLPVLRTGGLILYLRHGATDNTKPDRVPEVDLADCATQRPLTEVGRRAAAKVGRILRKARIPVGEVFASPLCRAKESARLAFGPAFRIEPALGYTANLTSSQKGPVLSATRELLSRPVPAGTNRVIVGHAPNLMDLMGYFPRECTLVVFRPTAPGTFTYVASIPLEHWSRLLD